MLIDNKDALTAVDDCNYKIMSGYEWIRKQEIKKRLKELPSAEPEVIRCKDCKYHMGEGCCDYWDEGRMFLDISDSDYCSKAERREEE